MIKVTAKFVIITVKCNNVSVTDKKIIIVILLSPKKSNDDRIIRYSCLNINTLKKKHRNEESERLLIKWCKNSWNRLAYIQLSLLYLQMANKKEIAASQRYCFSALIIK